MADNFMSQEEIDSLLSMADNSGAEESKETETKGQDIEVPDLQDLPDVRRVTKLHRWEEPQHTQKVTKYVSPVVKSGDVVYNPSGKEVEATGKVPVYRVFDFAINSA
ncbi:MAG: hypothetical protein GY863_04645 [bacterium]|nr:hypothetical protein [bacterium]